LRKKGEKITTFDSALARRAAEMIEAMHEAGGIGLAAQQVGRAEQICVVDLRSSDAKFDWTLDGKSQPPRDLMMPLVLVNPRVTAAPDTPENVYEEGCLSFPEIRGDVSRPEAVTAQYKDEHGVPHVITANGLLARCIQHEADHLHGILFIDRMEKEVRHGLDEAIKALAKKTKLSP
jgi:peptide deformylase